MIELIDLNNSEPYSIFEDLYKKAVIKKQKHIEALALSSFDNKVNSPDSRFVNLKYVINDEWIFFSNYESPKADQFFQNCNISCLFFWEKINTQIRMKAKISKTNSKISDRHFSKRSKPKNALAISSKQSKEISSYEKIKDNFKMTLSSENLMKRPDYWGGFSFTPYYFEFWESNEFRLNKRKVFKFAEDKWKSFILQP